MQVEQLRALINNVGAKKKKLEGADADLFKRWHRCVSTTRGGNVIVPPLDLQQLAKLAGVKPSKAEKI